LSVISITNLILINLIENFYWLIDVHTVFFLQNKLSEEQLQVLSGEYINRHSLLKILVLLTSCALDLSNMYHLSIYLHYSNTRLECLFSTRLFFLII
jgi:hypothetical protein